MPTIFEAMNAFFNLFKLTGKIIQLSSHTNFKQGWDYSWLRLSVAAHVRDFF